MIVTTILICAALVIVIELAFYMFLIPDPARKPLQKRPLDRHLGTAAYFTAYILSLLRAPLGLLPYLVKLFIFFALKIRYDSARSTYFREVINMAGDFVNLALTFMLILALAGPPRLQIPTFIFYLPLAAELVRLTTERIPVTFSATWQLMPHRDIARLLQARQQSNVFWRCFSRYCRYYALSDSARMQYILRALKQRATWDEDMSNRLEYIRAFRIVPLHYGLRGGRVRDIARGEVFIHSPWTNDPWLLAGMAIRRTPWMFDPRYLRRPFYYMTEANRLATLCVLEHARYSLPYAVFQFGHEIRVARLHLFYALLRRLGADLEYKVNADGSFQFDQFICWLEKRFGRGHGEPEQRSLYTDEEVIAEVLSQYSVDEATTAQDIASRYTYPLKYVEEVLLDKINTARACCYIQH
jgi:hypothetical protein